MQPAAQLGGKKGLAIQQHNCKVNKARPKYCTQSSVIGEFLLR